MTDQSFLRAVGIAGDWQSDLLAREPQSVAPLLQSQLARTVAEVEYFRGAACHWCCEAARWRRLARWSFGLLMATLAILVWAVGK